VAKGYDEWVAAGKPYRVVASAASLQETLQGHGYTVYAYPDEAHQTAKTPEDHTAYSATGWPGKAAFGVGYAIDIMPPKPDQKSKIDGLPLPNLVVLGDQLVADRMANIPDLAWLKYVNRTDSTGKCWHEKWQPDHARSTSNDKGHIHASARTDKTAATNYDPVARIRGGAMADDYGKYGRPKAIGDRPIAVLVADIWRELRDGTGAYEDKANPRGGVNARLDRVETAQLGSAAREIAAAKSIELLSSAVAALAAGGGVDAAPILARIGEVAGEIGELQTSLATATARADAAEARENALLAKAYADAAVPAAS